MRPGLLKNKVAMVTGAGRGIGRSIALALAREGASVALCARSGAELEQVAKLILRAGGRAACIPTDIASEESVAGAVEAAVRIFRRLDIVVNNAGMGIYGPLAKMKTVDWDRVMAVNARGPFLVCRETIPHLRKRRESYIVNIASVVGVRGYANQSVYSASKHAVMGMSKALAREVQADGIRVHAVCPGGVDTEMAALARPDLDRTELIKPEDVADAVLFLVTRGGNAVIDEVHIRRKTSVPWG